MARLFLWMMRLVVGSIVLIGLASTAIYLFLTRSIPEYSATHSIAGLSAPVEIVRNNANVPHILAETDADAFFALGFAHAQDRLWQMTLLRRTAQGRLSEVFGNRTLQTDELMRRLDIYGLAVSSLAAQDDETRAALDAYSRGVNAWIDIVNRDALGRGAPEFFLFSNEIAVWQPADSIAILKLLAVQMSSHLQSEVLRARISLLLPEERVADILPDDPTKGIAALPDYAALVPGGSAIPARDYAALVPGATGIATSAGRAALYPIAPYGLAGASNAWAAAAERSAAGGALLASDPHLPFTAPSVWYLARMTLHVIAEVQKKGGICAFVDAEHALDPVYARKLGVDLENLLISQPDTGEQALEIADTLVRSGAVDVLVIDSVAALTPRAEIEGEMG
ncbi:MAG: penicillin acylase family protein, partial [Paracoccaceae bacterium]